MHPRTHHSDDARMFIERSHAREQERLAAKPRLLPVEKEWSPYPVAKEQK